MNWNYHHARCLDAADIVAVAATSEESGGDWKKRLVVLEGSPYDVKKSIPCLNGKSKNAVAAWLDELGIKYTFWGGSYLLGYGHFELAPHNCGRGKRPRMHPVLSKIVSEL